MDPLEEQMVKLNIFNSRSSLNTTSKISAKSPLQDYTSDETGITDASTKNLAADALKKVPQSCLVKQSCEPLYSKSLQCSSDNFSSKYHSPRLQRKQPIHAAQKSIFDKASKVTLDNPAILEQQLEALTHHKKQLEKKGLLVQQQNQNKDKKLLQNISGIPKLSSTSFANKISSGGYTNTIYSNVCSLPKSPSADGESAKSSLASASPNVYSNVANQKMYQMGNHQLENDMHKKTIFANPSTKHNTYSNVLYEKYDLPLLQGASSNADPNEYSNNLGDHDSEIPPPPSPVSSSYSELRRATDVFSKSPNSLTGPHNDSDNTKGYSHFDGSEIDKMKCAANQQTYTNMNYNNDYISYSPTLQGSSTYESIYEPINPRPPSQMSSRSNYLMYSPYMNGSQLPEQNEQILSNSSSANISSLGATSASGSNTPLYPRDVSSNGINDLLDKSNSSSHKEVEVEALTDFLVHSMDSSRDVDNYGVCFKCNERVMGENSGCTAMDQIYHIACFTCSQCQINLQGKPFYALEGKPFCEYDYLQTLEKCSVCMKPILERILRATGKPYHPQCFTCIVCGNSLDGIPFTVDATNQNYCIADFHKKFAPRCCVCKEPIMPEPGEEETVRVVALDRSFHFECYKCEDCGLLLSSEAEGRGCYPLDDHVLCKSCNAKRVQKLTNHMTTDL